MSPPVGPDLEAERHGLLIKIAQLPEAEKSGYLPFVAQSSRTPDEIKQVAGQIRELLFMDSGTFSDEIYEASIEIAFIMGTFHLVDEAEEILRKVLTHAQATGDVLLEARSNINLAGLLIHVHNESPDNEQVLHNAISYTDRAIFLLDEDIYNEGFFLAQARHNKAIMLRRLGKYGEATMLYQKALDYFRTKDESLYAQTLSSIASLHFEQGFYSQALKTNNKAIRIIKLTRKYTLTGQFVRFKARILAATAKNQRRHLKALALLNCAVDYFNQAGNDSEVNQTEREIDKLRQLAD